MTKREKREAKIRALRDVRFRELAAWLQDEGLQWERGKGSHNTFVHPALPRRVVIVADEGVDEYQVRQAIAAVDTIRASKGAVP